MSKLTWGYILVAIYVLISFDLYWAEKVNPIIFGMPYALWSKVIYGILAVPVLHFVYKWIWIDLPDHAEIE